METETTLTLDIVGWDDNGRPLVRVVALTECKDASGVVLDIAVKNLGIALVPMPISESDHAT